jgi:peptidoglycan/xylan/chitin deacetylase (PgdA/CDA1 family)
MRIGWLIATFDLMVMLKQLGGRVASSALLVCALAGLLVALSACSGKDPEPPVPTPATTPGVETPTPGQVPPTAPSPTPPPPAPTQGPSPTPAPRPGELIWNGSRTSNMVALTFDMGGRVDPALDIMNWLIQNRVPATIFMTGAMVDNRNTDAGRQVLALVDKHRDLFVLANHSYSHPDFRDISADEMRSELRRAEESFARITSLSPRPYFRPPYGGQNAAVVSTVAAAGYPRVVMWDIDTIDWRPEAEGGPTAAFMVKKVLDNARGGSIVLMHLGGFNTYEALPAMVAGLKARGLELVTLADMLGH